MIVWIQYGYTSIKSFITILYLLSMIHTSYCFMNNSVVPFIFTISFVSLKGATATLNGMKFVLAVEGVDVCLFH